MRKFVVILLCGLSGLVLAGCGKSASSGPTPPAKPANGPTDAEIPVNLVENVQVVSVTADDTMHFNGNRFTVHTGQPVRIELANKGNRPITEMAHNFVILKSGIEPTTFNLISAQAKDSGYMPATESDKVLAFTALAGPGQTVTSAFTAPEPGKYTFLCNFPGHFAAGMFGAMTVVP